METNENLKEQIFEIITNQLNDNNPVETKMTYFRLMHLGFNEFDSKKLIGQCVIIELFDAIKNKKPFDKKRYKKNLDQLPLKPIE